MKRPPVLLFIVCVLGELAAMKSLLMAVILAVFITISFVILSKTEVISSYIKKYKGLIYTAILMYFLAVCAVGIDSYKSALDKKLEANVDKKIEITAIINSIEEKEDFVVLGLDKIVAYVPLEESGKIKIGYKVALSGTLSKPQRASNEGGFDAYSYYKSKHIDYILKVKNIEIKEKSTNVFKEYLYTIKKVLRKRVLDLYDEDFAGIISAALLGDKQDLSEDIYDMYRKSGIAHLLAISGLHISILGLSLYKLLRERLKLSFISSALTVSGFVYVYSIFTGSSISVIRAAGMLVLFCIAQVLGRTYDLCSAACILGIVNLLYSPYTLYQGAFQLSYMAVFSIGLVATKIIKRYKIKSFFLQSFIVSSVVSIYTLPIILYFFYSFSPYSIILNMLVIPLMSFIIYFAITALLFFGLIHPISIVCVRLSSLILEIYLVLIRIFEKLPAYKLLMGRASVWQLVLYYAIITVSFFALIYAKGLPDSKRGCKCKACYIKIGIYLTCCFLSVFILQKIRTKYSVIKFIDVGQGDGIYISAGAKNILIDAGSTSNKNAGRYVLQPFLESQRVGELDCVFLTHADLDHTNALMHLIKEDIIKVKIIYLPILALNDESYNYITEPAAQKKIAVKYIGKGDIININENISLTCISPSRENATDDSNEKSIMLIYKEDNFKAVFTGDAGRWSEEFLLKDKAVTAMLKNSTLLKVGHHGSFTASSEEFIDCVLPKYAVLSYAKNNRYNHPHRETVYRLEKHNIKSYHTAVSGQINFKIKNNKLYISEYLQN